MIIDITDKVKFENPDDESLPLTRCVCGKEFQPWGFILGVEKEEGWMHQCPNCKRFLFWELHVKVFEYTSHPDLKKEVSNEKTKG